ncbi:hypothetical protein BjapCC829_22925 [Bradyrhizobium barranii]|uniref:Uncharacterized protein n=1 Tax=Bradyrhizobium barranii TaxID=2992140 RepID=A0ABY3QD38_9BRAD|nr:hypothetical protein [Bradyrhizobium japonicum]UFW82846.1 hypothetical protein BjapCC829_22925 [Bradyrhizobium japonicum]
MQYFESSLSGYRERRSWQVSAGPGPSFGFGDSVSIELLQGERVQVYSNSINDTGELAVDSMGQSIAAQSIPVAGNGRALLGPVPDRGRVIVRVTAKTGYINVSVSG